MMFLGLCGFDEIPLVQRIWSHVAGPTSRRRVSAFTTVVFFLVWVNYLIWLISTYTFLLSFHQAGVIDESTWGFGQMVAVTIWVPCIFEYLYLEIRKSFVSMTAINFLTERYPGGMENVFQLRLGQYYKVVKMAPGDPAPTNTSLSV